jgi:predicted nucleic acid-binding Zn ribbon protein
MSKPIKIGKLIEKSVNKAGVSRQIEAARVCDLYRKILSSLDINKKALEKSKAIYFRNRILTVAVLGSSCAQELQMRQHLIIEGINKEIGKKTVERIIFHIA